MKKVYQSHHVAGFVNTMASQINKWALEKGFWSIPRVIGRAVLDDSTGEAGLFIERLQKTQKAALITTETSELVEGIRKKVDSQIPGFSNEEEEMADQIIRVLDYCGNYNLNIGGAIIAKMAVNEDRPYQHGKNF